MDANDMLTITLTAAQWNVVIGGLNELPYRISATVIEALLKQVNSSGQTIDAAVAATGGNGHDKSADASTG